MKLWGIDLGGTKIEGVVLEPSTSEVLYRERVPTEGNLGYEHVLNQILKLVTKLKEQSGESPTKIGIGTPGSIDPSTGLLKGCNSTHLNDRPFLTDVKKLLGTEVAVANDANCFALAETHMGIVHEVSPQAKVVFGIIMGTGVGGGLIVNGQAIQGRNGIAGEWGHNFLDDSGGKCYCGKTGCVETILSGPALEKYYHSISGEKLPLREIIGQKTTNPNAKATYDRLIQFFGLAVSTIVNMIDPEAIVIGGGVGNIDGIYTDGFESLKKQVFNPSCHTLVLKPKLGDSAGVFGTAYL
ncbi:ROK family protein [Reichenbachiella agarivorans]|uniref:ROK family protein n=1 Tax=Reichenbachiella agarivorans TaxID=2979464 RepID=A0ABY6CSD5_9BACT|nr:ROK family protein [Reichenbachiella agarivorans]UXP33406.1 ROK family protein [Reichenbachiella agarivorans]